MMRAQKEWSKRKSKIGDGKWNYQTNQQGLWDFWQEGIARNAKFDNLVTIGMRGDGDEPMAKGNDMKANIDLLEKIVADQRQVARQARQPGCHQGPAALDFIQGSRGLLCARHEGPGRRDPALVR